MLYSQGIYKRDRSTRPNKSETENSNRRPPTKEKLENSKYFVCVHPQQYQNDHILLVSLKATAVHNRFQTLAPLPNKTFRYETE